MTQEAKNKRDQLAALMQEMQDDQNVAIREAASFLGSTEAKEFQARIDGFQQRTVPGQHFDMIFGSLAKVIDSTAETCRQLVELEIAPARQPDAQEQAVEKAPPVEPAEPAPTEAQLVEQGEKQEPAA